MDNPTIFVNNLSYLSKNTYLCPTFGDKGVQEDKEVQVDAISPTSFSFYITLYTFFFILFHKPFYMLLHNVICRMWHITVIKALHLV